MIYLVGITIVLNVATASPAFVIIEVHVGIGDRGEVFLACIEPASTGGVCPLTTAGTAHVVDDSIHIDVDLQADVRLSVQHKEEFCGMYCMSKIISINNRH